MGRFWRWIGRILYWVSLFFALTAMPVVGVEFWQMSSIRSTLASGIPVMAKIRSIPSFHPRRYGETGYTGYCLNLSWINAQGTEQSANCVKITANYFAEITTGPSFDVELKVDHVAIKYLSSQPDAIIVLEDADEQQRDILNNIEGGLIYGAIGAAVVGFVYIHKRRKNASKTIARP